MSKLCIGIVKNEDIFFDVKFKIQIKEILNCYGYSVFYSLSYKEPFIDEYIGNNKYLIFSVADNEMFDNCEMLLLPDDCSFNGEQNKTSFYTRMRIIKKVIDLLLETEKELDLFVGDSGTQFDEFESYNIFAKDFLKISNDCLNLINAPDVHFIIKRNEDG